MEDTWLRKELKLTLWVEIMIDKGLVHNQHSYVFS